jgi:hypothetical protein
MEGMKESLSTMEDFKSQVSQGHVPTEEEEKQIATYPELVAKYIKWEEYANAKRALDSEVSTAKQKIDKEYKNIHRIKAFALISFCLDNAQKIDSYFSKLNNFKDVQKIANMYASRGFGTPPDHYVLEFYQVMVGSCARSLIESEQFNAIAPARLQEIFRDAAKPSRGYIPHNGVREEGKELSESRDRPEEFYTSLKQIIEAIPMLMGVKKALENGVSYKEALKQTQEVNMRSVVYTSVIF